MMDTPSIEKYTDKLLNRLSLLYREYTDELHIIETQLDNSSVIVLENYSGIEQHRFQQISSIEKVLNTHLRACSVSFQEEVEGKLSIMRKEALKMSREVREILKSHMKKIRTELSSIRFPGRVKNYKQESVPVLIDIET